MLPDDLPFRRRTIGTEVYDLVDWSHPVVEAHVLREMAEGFAVYYDREWPLTIRFCRFLLSRPEIFAGRSILVVAAGVGPEAVVAGRLGSALWINDLSPAALELLQRQLERNGVRDFHTLPGSLADIPLPAEIDLVVASFAVYDLATMRAMQRLLVRARDRSLPVLIANQEIGGYLRRLLREAPGPVAEIHRDEELRVIRCGPAPDPSTPP